MSVNEIQSTAAKPKRRWFQFILRTLLVFVLLVGFALSTLACYFCQARLDGKVLYAACVCGLKRAEISNGEVIILEPNHETPAGSVVAAIEIKDGQCILRSLREDGTVRNVQSCEIDHLGAKYYSEPCGRSVYAIMIDSWKLYPHTVLALFEDMFR